ncbi:MAG: DUF924 domain-containing protein [Desulfofustis sp.]|nr:DUF924 domain-containing protein [Desulfofustis sp.]
MYQEVLDFWFKEIEPRQWWIKDNAFDQLIRDRFSTIHDQASRCELFSWRGSAQGRLAEIVVLDQFSRNMFRGTARAFAQDQMALVLSQEAISLGIDFELPSKKRSFMYMPFMHSESLLIHEQAEALYRRSGDQSSLEYELKHKKIIERFGRYPHRNEILGRESTEEEKEFLREPGSSF